MARIYKLQNALSIELAWFCLFEFENLTSFSYFYKPEPKKTWSLKLAKTRTWKKRENWNSIESISEPQKSLPRKKMHVGQILVKIFSQTCKLQNLNEFWANFLKPKKLKLENIFELWNPKNSNPNLEEGTKLKPKEIQTLSSSNYQKKNPEKYSNFMNVLAMYSREVFALFCTILY